MLSYQLRENQLENYEVLISTWFKYKHDLTSSVLPLSLLVLYPDFKIAAIM